MEYALFHEMSQIGPIFYGSTQNHIKPRPTTHINEIERFYTMSMWTLANNIIIPHMIQNGQTVVEIWAFQDFYIKPRLLINMDDIITKNNRAHYRAMGYHYTTYDIYRTYSFWDIVFTS